MSEDASSSSEKPNDRGAIADAMAAALPLYASSVCLNCQFHRTIVSGKGSVFMLCQSEETPDHWPKYPPQPVSRCRYYRESFAE